MSDQPLNSIHKCEIVKVHDYGAFARIPDTRQQGLIHRSQVSSTRVDDVTEVLQQGERVWCKIISDTDGKIALSTKVVDQGNGSDLDPNGVQIYLDEQKKKKGPDYNKKRAITLDAVYNVTCAKCKTRGHLAKDCFKGADGKTYDLVSDNDEETSSVIPQRDTPEKSKAENKEKKRKRKKEKQEKSSPPKKKRKKEKQSKKSKKRARSDSSSSSSDLSDSSDSSVDSSDHRSKRKKKRKKSKVKSKKSSKR